MFSLSHSIACGGVAEGADVIEFMLAGATAVQSCTAILRKGSGIVKEMLGEIKAWCEAQRVQSLSEIIGTVTPHYKKTEKPS